MKLLRFLVRYYPPGIILEYSDNNNSVKSKMVDLLTLCPEYVIPHPILRIRSSIIVANISHRSNIEELAQNIMEAEPDLINSTTKRNHLLALMQSKLFHNDLVKREGHSIVR